MFYTVGCVNVWKCSIIRMADVYSIGNGNVNVTFILYESLIFLFYGRTKNLASDVAYVKQRAMKLYTSKAEIYDAIYILIQSSHT